MKCLKNDIKFVIYLQHTSYLQCVAMSLVKEIINYFGVLQF